MSRTNPFSMHTQLVWEERAADRKLPAWLRVASLAYGRHRGNGHAVFDRGQVALILGGLDPDTGEIAPMDRSNVHRAIAAAVAGGWLSPQSTSRCLVVPAHAVTGGLGSPKEECPQHRRPSPARGRPGLRAVS